jgi:hypothetical protein
LTLTKPVAEISVPPAIEAPEGDAFEGEQDEDRYQFARLELGLRMLVDFGQHIVYQAQKCVG